MIFISLMGHSTTQDDASHVIQKSQIYLLELPDNIACEKFQLRAH
jgi:hypothetical protein